MRIGLIQTQRLGDLIITLPIARWFLDRGHEVCWPIRYDLLPAMTQAEPDICFLPVAAMGQNEKLFFYYEPMQMLCAAGCQPIFSLYIHLDDQLDRRLASLKFDEYKYAVTGVPFAEKWKLRIKRDAAREAALHASLGIEKDYVLVHDSGSMDTVDVRLPAAWLERYQIVTMEMRTDNPFDWISTIEKASKRVMLDSSFANLTEQLNITGDNYLIQRSIALGTPVSNMAGDFAGRSIPSRKIVE